MPTRQFLDTVHDLIEARAEIDPQDPSLGRLAITTPLGPVLIFIDPKTKSIVGVSGPGAGMFPGVPIVPHPQRPMDPPTSGSGGPMMTTVPPPPVTPLDPDDPGMDPSTTMPPGDPMSGVPGSNQPSDPGDYPAPNPDAGGGDVAADRDGDVVVGARHPGPLRAHPAPQRNPADPGYVDPSPDGAAPVRSSTPSRPGTVVVDPGRDATGRPSPSPNSIGTAAEAVEHRLGGVIDPPDPSTADSRNEDPRTRRTRHP